MKKFIEPSIDVVTVEQDKVIVTSTGCDKLCDWYGSCDKAN